MPTDSKDMTHSWMPLIILGAALYTLYVFWNVLILFVLAAILAFVLNPAVSLLDRKLPHVASTISVFLIGLIALIILAGTLAPMAADQLREFSDSVPSFMEKASANLHAHYAGLPGRWQRLVDRGLSQLEQAALRITQVTIPAVIGIISSAVAIIFIPLLAFFMLLHYKDYKRALIAVMPEPHRETIADLLSCVSRSLWGFVRGQALLMLAVGTMVGLGLWLIGMPYPIVFGLMAGLLEVVTNVGPTIVTLTVAAIGLLISPILALEAAAVTVVVQILENTLLAPLVLSKSAGLDPVTVILAIFLGGSLAGVLGAIIAIPIALVVKIVIVYFYGRDEDFAEQARGICRPSRRRAHSGD